MNIADIIEVKKETVAPWTEATKQRLTALHENKEAFSSLGALFKSANTELATRDEKLTVTKIRMRAKEAYENAAGTLLSHQEIDEGFLDRAMLSGAAQALMETPMSTLSEVRAIADKLSFIVTPFDYLDPRSYEQEPSDMRIAINVFGNRELKRWFNIYVLSPVRFYNARQHAESESDLPIYASPALSQAFAAISMTMPMFRTLVANVKQLDERSVRQGSRINELQAEMTNLTRRVSELEVQVERVQREQVIAAARQREMEAQLASYQASFSAYEPMMIAVPKHLSIHDEGGVFIGPCWGPDFPDIVAAALSLREVKGQRSLISKSASRWARVGRQ